MQNKIYSSNSFLALQECFQEFLVIYDCKYQFHHISSTVLLELHTIYLFDFYFTSPPDKLHFFHFT